MTEIEYSRGEEAESLCMACGLCCTGHLFSWVQIKSTEQSRLGQIGLTIIQPGARHHGFSQPCPMWDGECSIYRSKNYPSGCRSFNCRLLRELLDEEVSFSKALGVVKQTKEKIGVIEKLLPASNEVSFRELLIERLDHIPLNPSLVDEEFRSKASELLSYFDKRFGVRDFLGSPKSK